MVTSRSEWPIPTPVEAFPCGSRSTTRTRFPASARHAPRLTAVVLLPTPPFWLAMAMIRAVRTLSAFRDSRLLRFPTSTPDRDAFGPPAAAEVATAPADSGALASRGGWAADRAAPEPR